MKLLNKNGLLVEEGDETTLGSQIPQKPGARVFSFTWHPNTNVVAVGWENGDLGCYGIGPVRAKWVYASPAEEYANLGAICQMHWIGNHGNELVTVDSTGLLIIWTFDQMSTQLTSRASHQLNDEVTDAVAAVIDGDAGLYLSSASGIPCNFSVISPKQLNARACSCHRIGLPIMFAGGVRYRSCPAGAINQANYVFQQTRAINSDYRKLGKFRLAIRAIFLTRRV